MATPTPIYKFPIPDDTAAADGPTAIAALANAVETKMANYRGATYNAGGIAESRHALGSEFSYAMLSIPSTVNGWVEFEYEFMVGSDANGDTVDPTKTIAGTFSFLIGSTVLRSHHFDNQQSTGYQPVTGRVAFAVQGSNTQTPLEIRAFYEAKCPASLVVLHQQWRAIQFGSTAT